MRRPMSRFSTVSTTISNIANSNIALYPLKPIATIFQRWLKSSCNWGSSTRNGPSSRNMSLARPDRRRYRRWSIGKSNLEGRTLELNEKWRRNSQKRKITGVKDFAQASLFIGSEKNDRCIRLCTFRGHVGNVLHSSR